MWSIPLLRGPIRQPRPWLTASGMLAMAVTVTIAAPSATDLPLLHVADLEFVGAFRLPAAKFGCSSLNYSEGPIAVNPHNRSLFIVGHSHQQAIAEFALPELVRSSELADLRLADPPLQPFVEVLNRAAGGNAQHNDRIGGLLVVEGPNGVELLVNAYEYYDAPGDNTESLLAMRDATDLANCRVDGYFEVTGGPGHTAGWMSPIPAAWQTLLGGKYLLGHSSGLPIISRASVGPSAFVFDPFEVVGKQKVTAPVSTLRLLDFSLRHRLHDDLRNESKKNDLWTHLSRAVYGVLLPGTRTLATFGYSGGHQSSVGYKNVRDDGTRSGGYSAYAIKDNYHYYWLWDVAELLRVKAGDQQPHQVRPYAYGKFVTPFSDRSTKLGGGAFDPASGLLYLTVQAADRAQGRYANPPVVVAYRVATAH